MVPKASQQSTVDITSAVKEPTDKRGAADEKISSGVANRHVTSVKTVCSDAPETDVTAMEKEVLNLKQERIYLQYKVDSLEDELTKVKVNKDEQRIRALDLKHELSEVSICRCFLLIRLRSLCLHRCVV